MAYMDYLGDEARRGQKTSGNQEKNKVKHVCESVLLRQTIPWHLMKKVLPGHIQ